jgi:hypothetical protein
MPRPHHRPLTEAEIAEIRQRGPGFHIFKRAKDTREVSGIYRFITRAVFLVVATGLGFALYKYIISSPH